VQTMPDKNRRMVTIGAILAGAVVLGALAFFAFNREREPMAQTNPSPVSSAPLEDGTGEPVSPVAAPGTSTGGTGTPLDGNPAEAAAEEETGKASPEQKSQPGENKSGEGAAVTPDGDSVPATHVVAPGETLRDISLKYYGDPVYAGDIEALNNLADPNHIEVGQILQLPRPEDLH